MKSLILRVQIIKVRKHELSSLMNETIQVVEMNNPEALHILVQLNRLKALLPELNGLQVSYGAFPETEQLKVVRTHFNNLIGGILHQNKALECSMLGALSAERELVIPFVKRYLKNNSSRKTTIVVDRVRKMVVQLEADAVLQAAVTKVGMQVYFDELKNLLDSYDSNRLKRLEAQQLRPVTNTPDVKSLAGKALSNLLDAIEVAKVAYETLDYEPLISNLNKLYSTYKASQKAMSTRNKNSVMSRIQNETTVASSPTTTATAI